MFLKQGPLKCTREDWASRLGQAFKGFWAGFGGVLGFRGLGFRAKGKFKA